jgi:hypothetical protein
LNLHQNALQAEQHCEKRSGSKQKDLENPSFFRLMPGFGLVSDLEQKFVVLRFEMTVESAE